MCSSNPAIKHNVSRETNRESGLVCNDYGRDDKHKRPYNYPWIATLYMELYALWGRKDDLLVAYRVMKEFYNRGGKSFYAFEIPVEMNARENGKSSINFLNSIYYMIKVSICILSVNYTKKER